MNQRLHIVTCSYAPDRQRCERLCRSIDEFVPAHIRHTLIVPRRDLASFLPLANRRRDVVATQDVVPGHFVQLPGLKKWWVDGGGWPVRGWIMQQVTKLSANHVTDAEYILFSDSDLVFCRDFDEQRVTREGKLRLHAIPGAKSSGEHLLWHQRACQLLGLPAAYQGSDYIGPMVTWRRRNLVALHDCIEETTGKPWYRAVARSLRFSEYILYGVFVDKVLGREWGDHYACSDDPCFCCWDSLQVDALHSGDYVPGEGTVALLAQSNLGLSPERENEIFKLARQRLDAAGAGVGS